MAEVTINLLHNDNSYTAGAEALAQFERGEAVSIFANEAETEIPFHEISSVIVNNRGVIFVTPSDDNCPGGSVKTCDDVHFFSGQAGDLSEIHPGDVVHLGENQILVASNDTEPTEDNSLEITATSSNTSVATVSVIHEGVAWHAAFEVESQDGQTIITVTVPSHGCQAQFTFETGII